MVYVYVCACGVCVCVRVCVCVCVRVRVCVCRMQQERIYKIYRNYVGWFFVKFAHLSKTAISRTKESAVDVVLQKSSQLMPEPSEKNMKGNKFLFLFLFLFFSLLSTTIFEFLTNKNHVISTGNKGV